MSTLGLVLVIHGSRYPGTVEQMSALLDTLQALRPADRVAGAYLEILSPNVGQVIDTLVAEGRREVVLLPYFVLDGRHTREDLPRLATEAMARHPGLAVRVGPPVGVRRDVLAGLLAGAGLGD
jgi:sirohydrochlorin ferrochelatase